MPLRPPSMHIYRGWLAFPTLWDGHYWGGRGGGRDPGRGKGWSVGRQMVPQWDSRAVREGQRQRRVDVSDDLEDSSSSEHSGSEEQGRKWKESFSNFSTAK